MKKTPPITFGCKVSILENLSLLFTTLYRISQKRNKGLLLKRECGGRGKGDGGRGEGGSAQAA